MEKARGVSASTRSMLPNDLEVKLPLFLNNVSNFKVNSDSSQHRLSTRFACMLGPELIRMES